MVLFSAFAVFTLQSVASLRGEDDILPPVVWSNAHPEVTLKKAVLLVSSCRQIEIFVFNLEHSLSVFWVQPVILMP